MYLVVVGALCLASLAIVKTVTFDTIGLLASKTGCQQELLLKFFSSFIHARRLFMLDIVKGYDANGLVD